MATAKIIELNETNTCKICDNALAKYSCPRCHIIYCSLNCYQANSHLQCSEHFYKDNILNELNLDKDGEESKAKMLEILQTTHENNRISFNVDEDDEDLDFENLKTSIRMMTMIMSEDITKLIPSWQPWWLYYKESKVEEVTEEEDFKNGCPKICSIKDFSQITTKSPSECVKYNLFNIISSYVFTTRYFNGEHFDFAREAVSCITSLSLTLKAAQNFEDFETAVKSVEQECFNVSNIYIPIRDKL
ncbi:hypothetical protein NQ314_013083 [Rhamnusium bicolor]|uniref:HIT-type domain-containing protein n=1 Tax=Rhamnusium bicolor TaxID=1586634 RepID=A0AAV8X809_9CUCU|nr:hypothetical protein NQ314_013083 [Rhamnusium bicolor]